MKNFNSSWHTKNESRSGNSKNRFWKTTYIKSYSKQNYQIVPAEQSGQGEQCEYGHGTKGSCVFGEDECGKEDDPTVAYSAMAMSSRWSPRAWMKLSAQTQFKHKFNGLKEQRFVQRIQMLPRRMLRRMTAPVNAASSRRGTATRPQSQHSPRLLIQLIQPTAHI